MRDFHYLVTVSAESKELADQVIAERINFEEEYGPFEYGIANVTPAEFEVSTYRGESDNVPVVQIDTTSASGRIRINLNDAPIWDADPEAAKEVGVCQSHTDAHYFRNDPDPCIGYRRVLLPDEEEND